MSKRKKGKVFYLDNQQNDTDIHIIAFLQCKKCGQFYNHYLEQGSDEVVISDEKIYTTKIISQCKCGLLQEGLPYAVKIKYIKTGKELLFNLQVGK